MTDNTTPKHVPAELTHLVDSAILSHEKEAKALVDSGDAHPTAIHTSVIGYYTGILTMLVLAGYDDPNDPYLKRLDNLRNAHASDHWPLRPKGTTHDTDT